VQGAFDYRDKVNLPKAPERRPRPPKARKPAASHDKTPPQPPGDRDPFTRFDANGDGKLDKSEVPERMQAVFAELDKNSDGAVTRDEWAAARQMMMRQRPSGPGAPPGGPRP